MRNKIYHKIDQFVRRFMPELRLERMSMNYLLAKRGVETSVAYIEQHMLYAEPFSERESFFSYVMERIPDSGLVLEFGVLNAGSINFISSLTKRTVHGFDSFEGLPDDKQIPKSRAGQVKWYAGKMDMGGKLPEVSKNVELHKGWFDEVLPGFFKDHKGPLALLHIDSDIYSSAKYVLDKSRGRIEEGTVIIFDDYLNFEGWRRHEHRALMEFAAKTGMRYEFIAYTYQQAVAIKVLGFGQPKPMG